MIKQIWFVRNVKKLINYLCVTAGAFILFYSLLCVFALGDGLMLGAIVSKYALTITLPSVQLIISLLFMYLYHRIDKTKSDIPKQKKSLIKKLLCGTNLIITLLLFFIQINNLNSIKGLESFGLFPIFLTIIGGVAFYIITIIKQFKK